MTLNLTIPQQIHTDFTPRITVIGVGGGGTNAVDNMITANLQGVEFVVANTDAQQLMHSRADRRIQLGPHITQGLGAGAKPEIGAPPRKKRPTSCIVTSTACTWCSSPPAWVAAPAPAPPR